MNATFLTKDQLGRLTHGKWNKSFRPAVHDGRRVHIALTGETTHAQVRARHSIKQGTDGYTYLR